jgi:hypothetical protein
MSVQERPTLNFLVPAQGGTQVVAATFPGDCTDVANSILDFKSLNLQLGGSLFIPQAVTVDASKLPSGTSLLLTVLGLNLSWIIPAGITKTMQFPALPDLAVQITPSAGNPSFNTFWYNYPALPDENILTTVTATLSGPVNANVIQMPISDGNDDSSASPADAAHVLATIAANPARRGYVVQNQSADQLQVKYLNSAGAGTKTIILLEPSATGAGHAGQAVDFNGMPHQGEIVILGPNAGAQLGARDW